jgi:UDP-glucose 4-epimerase
MRWADDPSLLSGWDPSEASNGVVGRPDTSLEQAQLKTLVIGGCGYIGSALFLDLERSGYDVDTVDLEWFGNWVNPANRRLDYRCLTRDDLRLYEAVILLAGHSSVPMCSSERLASFENNVVNFLGLLEKLRPTQRFLYASSAGVYGRHGETLATEAHADLAPLTYYDLQKREIDEYARMSGLDYYGLRFGTVNGGSPHLRTDIMINQMYHSAKTQGVIRLANPTAKRPILGLSDLCRAITTLLREPSQPGLYNLASFNATVWDIARRVQEQIPDAKLQLRESTPCYDMQMSTDKFERTYRFEFRDTCASIVASLDRCYLQSAKTTRSERRAYVYSG